LSKSTGLWLDTQTAQKWIKDNPALTTWLSNYSSKNTKSTYLHSLYKFCSWVKLSPQELLEIRGLTDNAAVEVWRKKLGLGKSIAIIADRSGVLFHDLIIRYLTTGETPDMRPNMKGRINKLSESSKWQKRRIDAAIRSFFAYANAPLPALKKPKFQDSDRTNKKEFMELDEAKKIIAATKEPYKALFQAALYAALSQDELLQVIKLWQKIQPELGKDTVKVEFAHRKNNPQPYYVYLPTKIFSNLKTLKQPFRTAKGQPIFGYDIQQTFTRNRQRAQVNKKITLHNFRDLWRTLASKADMKPDVAEFFMGHIIDPMGYNQVYSDEEYVIKEWVKVAAYIDSGLSSEAQGKIIELETVKNATLTQIQAQQKQLAGLSEALRQSLVMQLRETVKLNELETNLAKKKERQQRIDQLEQQLAALDKAAEPIVVAKISPKPTL